MITGPVAQRLEQGTHNPLVAGSNPAGPTMQMKYKYNITHKVNNKVDKINFKTKQSLLKYLNNNREKVNKLANVAIYFNQVMLPLKQTPWYDRRVD